MQNRSSQAARSAVVVIHRRGLVAVVCKCSHDQKNTSTQYTYFQVQPTKIFSYASVTSLFCLLHSTYENVFTNVQIELRTLYFLLE